MNKIYTLVFFLALFSCKKETHKNAEAKIIGIEVLSTNAEGLKIDTVISIPERQSVFLLPNKALPKELKTLTINIKYVFSKNAQLVKGKDVLTFSNPSDTYEIIVKAENGDEKKWHLFFAGNQLQNNDFEIWYDMYENGIRYRNPGIKDSSFWGTTNNLSIKMGYAGVSRFPEASSKQLKMTTGSTKNYPILTAAVFTNYNEQKLASVYPQKILPDVFTGIPYGLRPKSLQLGYRYQPGKKLIQAVQKNAENANEGFELKELEGVDKCQITVLLVREEREQIIEIGKVELFSSIFGATLKPIKIPFEYSSEKKPTHLIFFATSSAEGNILKGAVGSSLIIDNVYFEF